MARSTQTYREARSRLLVGGGVDLTTEGWVRRRDLQEPLHVGTAHKHPLHARPEARSRPLPVISLFPLPSFVRRAVRPFSVGADQAGLVCGDVLLDLDEMPPAIRTLLVASAHEPFMTPRRSAAGHRTHLPRRVTLWNSILYLEKRQRALA